MEFRRLPIAVACLRHQPKKGSERGRNRDCFVGAFVRGRGRDGGPMCDGASDDAPSSEW